MADAEIEDIKGLSKQPRTAIDHDKSTKDFETKEDSLGSAEAEIE